MAVCTLRNVEPRTVVPFTMPLRSRPVAESVTVSPWIATFWAPFTDTAAPVKLAKARLVILLPLADDPTTRPWASVPAPSITTSLDAPESAMAFENVSVRLSVSDAVTMT